MKDLNWQKVGALFIGFAVAKALYDYFSIGVIDFYGVIGIPLIALGLIYLIDKGRLMKDGK